jgi:hypothetical protein
MRRGGSGSSGRVSIADIIKNNRYVYTVEPGKPESDFTFTDSEAATGEAYYYVRVLQYDGQVAWSSQIWVTRK